MATNQVWPASPHYDEFDREQRRAGPQHTPSFDYSRLRTLTSDNDDAFSRYPPSPSRQWSATSSSSSSRPLALLTASARKGGMRPSLDADWDFDGASLLEEVLPDSHVRVLVATWNMQEQKEHPQSLDDLLLPVSQEVVADICVVGTQESTPARHEWEVLVQQTLGARHLLVHSASLGSLHILLFLRRDLLWYCSAVRSASVSLRPSSLINTKGAIALSFSLFKSSFLFVTSHLSAHQDRVAERNADVRKITDNLALADDTNRRSALEGHEHVFWLGDLNYRVEMERERTEQCLRCGNLKALLLEDQLTKEMLQGNVFVGFSEQPISFPPSYKFDLNSDIYDSSEKRRIPSWTDRILYRSRTSGGITGCGYNCCKRLRTSDHRPVYGAFRVRLRPSSLLDSIPETLASFDRDVFLAAQQRRRALARLCTSKQRGQHLQSSTGSVTSSFCSLL